jgi:hypothetical protein
VRSVEMTESNQERRRQIRERVAKATKGPWHWTDPGDGRFMIGTAGGDGQMYHADAIAYVLRSTARGEVLLADLDLIAHAPDDLAWYEGQLTQAEAERDALRRIVDSECPIGALDLVTSLRVELQHVRERAGAAEREAARLREALEVYSNEANWGYCEDEEGLVMADDCVWIREPDDSGWDVARAALAAKEVPS